MARKMMEVSVCDVCGVIRNYKLRICCVCKLEYCDNCEIFTEKNPLNQHLCRRCGEREDVKRVLKDTSAVFLALREQIRVLQEEALQQLLPEEADS